MKQYLNLLQNILDNGVEKESGRANMPNTLGISFGNIEHDLGDGFPLLTTKKMYWKGILHELIWFLRGETNIKYLVDNKTNIWNQDGYRWYLKNCKERGFDIKYDTLESFIEAVKTCDITSIEGEWDSLYHLGDLGKVYGYQWRNQNGVDQISNLITGLQTNPYSRYHIVNAWNAKDFSEMALPPCHLMYQFITRPLTFEEKIQWVIHNVDLDLENLAITEEAFSDKTPKFYLDLNMYQRSCDTFLGVPFNIASYALFTHMIAQVVKLSVGDLILTIGDAHIYNNHNDAVTEQLSRTPMDLAQLWLNPDVKDITEFSIDDCKLLNYNCHPTIKAEMAV